MISIILAIILIGIFIYSLPFLLVNGAILTIFVILSRKKTGWIFNAIIIYMGINQLRKGILIWGILFLALGLIKSINFIRIGKEKSDNAEYKENYRKVHRAKLINNFFDKVKDKMEYVENKRQNDEIYSDSTVYEDLELVFGIGNRHKPKDFNGKRIITVADREELNLYKQQQIVKKETKEQLDEALIRKERKEESIAKRANNVNSNIPQNLNINLRSEDDINYKESLLRMARAYEDGMCTSDTYSQQLKGILSVSMAELLRTIDYIGKLNNIRYDSPEVVYNDNYNFINLNNMDNLTDNRIDNSQFYDVHWLESQDLDFEKDINAGINVYSDYDFDYKQSVMDIMDKEKRKLDQENEIELNKYKELIEQENYNIAQSSQNQNKPTHKKRIYTEEMSKNIEWSGKNNGARK